MLGVMEAGRHGKPRAGTQRPLFLGWCGPSPAHGPCVSVPHLSARCQLHQNLSGIRAPQPQGKSPGTAHSLPQVSPRPHSRALLPGVAMPAPGGPSPLKEADHLPSVGRAGTTCSAHSSEDRQLARGEMEGGSRPSSTLPAITGARCARGRARRSVSPVSSQDWVLRPGSCKLWQCGLRWVLHCSPAPGHRPVGQRELAPAAPAPRVVSLALGWTPRGPRASLFRLPAPTSFVPAG